MGNCSISCRTCLKQRKNITVVITGLDNSGKTTMVKRLIGEPIDSVLKTVGFSRAILSYHGHRITFYDLGGSSEIRAIWDKYFMDAHGLIYMVDANDISRLGESKIVFSNLLSHENISGKPVLLLANKQDKENALDEFEIVEHLNVERTVNKYRCLTRVELCSALLSESSKIDFGIKNGFTWLIDNIVQDYTNLNHRVLQDMISYSARVQKDLDEWKAQVTVEHDDEELVDVPFENVNPFVSCQQLVKNIIRRECSINSANALPNKSQSDRSVIDRTPIRTNHFTVKTTSPTLPITTTAKARNEKSKSSKLSQLYQKHKKRINRFNKIAPMPMSILMQDDSVENRNIQISAHSMNDAVTSEKREKFEVKQINYLVRRPATAPPRVYHRW